MKRSATLFLTAIAMTLASCGEAIHPSRVKATFVNYDDTILFVASVEYGGTATYQGDTPTRPTTADSFHYVFDGWDLPLDGLKEDTTFIAQYKEETNQYAVEFKNWDDELLETTYVLHGGDVTYTGAEPTRPRTQQFTYSFSGWDKPLTNITSSQTLHAQFEEEVNQYTVTFKNEDGSVLAVSTVDYGGTAEYRGKTPTKEPTEQYHYAFAGWDIPLTNITEDCEATAQFESSLNEFTVTFLNYDGDELGVDVVEYGGTAVYSGNEPLKPKTPQHSYLFNGWNKSLTNITADTEVTATFEEIVNRYTVTFINDDGTRLGSDEVEYGGTAVYPNENPTIPATAKYSYEFIGWDKPLTNITEDCERYAQYRSSVNSFNVVFKNYDGSILSEETVQYGDDAYYHGPTPEKAGNQQYSYHFIGWDVSLNGVTHDIVAIAQYVQVINQYTVTFKNYDGTTLGTCTVDYGSPASYGGAEPAREADSDNTYQFNGWDIPLECITADCVATAQYLATPIIKEVKVTFKIKVVNLGARTITAAGDFNYWNPTDTPLIFQGDDVYSFSYTALAGQTITYKYVLDGTDWDTLNASNRTYTFTAGVTEEDDGVYDLIVTEETTIDAIQSFTNANENKIYRFSGILEALSHTDKYGNAVITDPVSGNRITIHGMTTTTAAIVWNNDGTALEYKNQKDAMTTLASVNNGDLVTVYGIYNATFKNFSVILESSTTATTTYTASVTNESGVTLSKAEGLAYGEEVTVNIAVPDGKVVDSVAVDHGYGTETVEAVEGVYKFGAKVTNKVLVTFTDAPAPTGKISYDLATKGAEFTYVSDGTTVGTSYKEVEGRISGVNFHGSRTSYNQNIGTAPWATSGLICQYLLKGTDSTSTDASTVYFTVTAGYAFTKASFTVQDWNKDKVAAYLEYSTDGEAWTKDGGTGLEFNGSAADAETHALETADTISAKYVRLVVKPASNVTQGKNDYRGRIGIFSVDLTYPEESKEVDLHAVYYEKFADASVQSAFETAFEGYIAANGFTKGDITYDSLTPEGTTTTFATDVEAFQGTVDYQVDVLLGVKAKLGEYITTNYSVYKVDGANFEYPLGDSTDRRLWVRNDTVNTVGVEALVAYFTSIK